jgi:NMD protein affecting ribosome stability and mRNA decay
MTFISAIEISNKYGSSGKRGSKISVHDIRIATDKSTNKKTSQTMYSLRITVSSDIIKAARFIEGDKVDVLFDLESTPKRILIVRSLKEGWTLIKSNKGEDSRYGFKITHRPEMPSFAEAVDCDAVVTPEGILFDIPSTAVFGRNARAE